MTALGRWGAELGHEHAEGFSISASVPTYDTGTKRTGTRSFKMDAGAGNAITTNSAIFAGVVDRTYYGCGHLYIPSATGLPSTNAVIMGFFTSVSGRLGVLQLTTGGKVQLLNSGLTQIGSDSAATVATDTWYRLEIVVNINSGAGADDTLTGYLDGVQIATSSTQTIGTTAPGIFRFGWIAAPGANKVSYWDDLGLNDDQGSVNNGLLGNTKVGASFAIADDVLGLGSWTDGAGGTTNVFGSIDNIPPHGVATASSAASDQIENPVSPGSIAVFTMQSYTTIGVGASDTIQCLFTVVEIGSSSTTGSDTITHRVLSNPVGSTKSSSCDIVAGTYPSGWNQFVGAIKESPTVTLGTSPTVSIQKDVSTTRINSCCLAAMVVAWTPSAGVAATRKRSIMMVGD